MKEAEDEKLDNDEHEDHKDEGDEHDADDQETEENKDSGVDQGRGEEEPMETDEGEQGTDSHPGFQPQARQSELCVELWLPLEYCVKKATVSLLAKKEKGVDRVVHQPQVDEGEQDPAEQQQDETRPEDAAQAAETAARTQHDSQQVQQSDAARDAAGDGNEQDEVRLPRAHVCLETDRAFECFVSDLILDRQNNCALFAKLKIDFLLCRRSCVSRVHLNFSLASQAEGVGLSQSEEQEGHKGDRDTSVARGGGAGQQQQRVQRTPGQSDADRVMGSVDEKVQKRLKTIDSNTADNSEAADEQREQQSDLYEHVKDAASQHDAQTMDAATDEQASPLCLFSWQSDRPL